MSTIEDTKINLKEEFIKSEVAKEIQAFKISDIYLRLEKLDKKIDDRFDKLDNKFLWLYGIIAAVMIAFLAPITLEHYHLINQTTTQKTIQETK